MSAPAAPAPDPGGHAPASAITRLSASTRALVRDLWYVRERMLHPARRSRALVHAHDLAPIRSALFVCHGNVCRSPFAAVLFQRLMAERGLHPDVSSAGFIGPGRQPPAGALSAAARRGYDMAAHRSSVLTAGRLRVSDLIVVMSPEQGRAISRAASRTRGIVVLGDYDPRTSARRAILDPWNGDDGTFDESYDRITRCVAQLVDSLAPQAW